MTKPRFNPNLLKVPIYIAGKSVEEVKDELGLTEVIKLASNESPVGPSPMAVEAARIMLSQAHRYPGIVERDLRRKLAVRLDPGLNEHNFVLGNGGTDIIRMITQAFVFDGGNTVMGQATFPMYHISTSAFGGTSRQVELLSDYSLDLPGMLKQIDNDTRIVFLCSPNNPTGKIITQAEADEFIAQVPEHVIVVFDEAYWDFVKDEEYADSLAYVKAGHNVLSIRSFSKSAGLANMRVGYLVGPEELTFYIRHAQIPFHIGAISLVAAAASLDDREYYQQNRMAVWEGREYLYSTFTNLNLTYLPSHANYVTILDPPIEANALAEALLTRGVIVRPMAAFGMPNGVRVSVGSQDDNKKFIQALKNVLQEEAK